MAAMLEFVRELLDEGTVTLREVPKATAEDRRDTTDWLHDVYLQYRLDVAGPLLDFVPKLAVEAAEFLWQSCWCLVRRDIAPELIEQNLLFPHKPERPEQHLSVDLLFHFLPQIHRRARALSADDILTRRLEEVLCVWPLSGVLADVSIAPASGLDFCGHSGLQLLYAERFQRHPRPEWKPDGATGEYVDLVNR
jgi:hypothetical protein